MTKEVETSTEPKQQTGICGMSRRMFTAGCVGAAATLALGGLKTVPAQAVVRPPGGQDEDRLLGACIRCEKCYEACPNKVINLARFEDGIINMRTPKMLFDNGFCDFCQEANDGVPKCVEVCPTNALKLPADAEPKTTIIGLAVINTNWCLAYNLRFCRSCYDACPYEAMKLDDANRPVVLNDLCNGCGACESVCISMQSGSIAIGETERAIVVRPLEA